MLKFGMIGGGLGSYIGKFHRWGAMLDDSAELVCGCFSRSMDKNRATAEAYHLPDTSRVYADFREMADKESTREDGIDFVSIMTANDTHYEIAKCFLEHDIHVICDKPLALRTEEAEELARIAEERGLLFGITYSYTGYALIRQAREMIRAGVIGDILHVRVQHPEDWVISGAVDGKVDTSAWRFQPKKVGSSLCANDLGTHAEQMVTQFTGLHVKRVLAMMDTYPRDLPLDTNVNVLMDFGGGVTGALWASQIAIGHECDSGIYVIGTEGSLEWTATDCDHLIYTPRSQPSQRLSAGADYLLDASTRLSRVGAGHNEGFIEAFSNIYRSFCNVLSDRKAGRENTTDTFPTVEDGVLGVRFVEACVRSHTAGGVWMDV